MTEYDAQEKTPRPGACMTFFAHWALALVLSSVHGAASAEPGVTLPEVRISASVLPLTPAAASEHVTVIDHAELVALGNLSVAEVLARQAGMVVDRSPRSGGFGSLFLRGADPSHVVVLIDHVRQNDPLSSRGSAVDLNTLTTDDIERIEIVRGSVSVVHPEAMAGVVHIFTRAPAGTGRLGVGAGGDGFRAAHTSIGDGKLHAGVSVREEGDRATGFSRSRSVNGRWQHELTRSGSLSISARASDSLNVAFPDDSGGQQLAVLRTLDSRESESQQVAARAAFNTTDAGRLEFDASWLSRNGEESTPGVAPGLRDPAGLPAMDTGTDYQRRDFQVLWLSDLGDQLLLTMGLQHQQESGRFDSRIDFGGFSMPARFDLKRRITSALMEARLEYGAWTLQGGFRHEMPDQGGASTQPKLSLRYAFGEGRGHWGVSVSRASKLPSFYALGHPLIGDPLLRTERSTQHEIYYASSGKSSWPTRITLFSARYKDLVDFDPGPPPRLVNRARIDAEGLEWGTRHLMANGWRLQLEGVFMNVRDPNGVAALRFRPHTQWSAQLVVPWGERRELSLLLNHLGRRLDSSIPTGQQSLPAITIVDLSASMPIHGARATLAVDNLFDDRHPQTIGTPTPERRLRIALEWRLS